MTTTTQRAGWVQFLVLLGLTAGLGCIAPAAAGEPKKDPFDPVAEAEQEAKEDADQAA